jgi:hypothetical protein
MKSIRCNYLAGTTVLLVLAALTSCQDDDEVTSPVVDIPYDSGTWSEYTVDRDCTTNAFLRSETDTTVVCPSDWALSAAICPVTRDGNTFTSIARSRSTTATISPPSGPSR